MGGGNESRTAVLADVFAAHAQSLAGALASAGYPDATDAVQEAFVQAVVHWKRVARYDDPVQWIRRVAINRARNRRRGRSRQHALAERMAAQPALTAAAPEIDDGLTAALTSLPEQQRLACALFYFSDLPVAQVADAMGISEGAVKYHLHAARAALAATLEVRNGS
jgi:RNA polymerase sigma-70 factor (ECF subfamily)